MAGHSRWAQVKHKKAVTDVKKGKLFSKYVREITVAARSGPPDPAANPRLRSAIERARTGGLPKDNIERAVAKATGGGEGTELKEFLYEASVDGVAMLIEGITDNTNRSLAEIRKIITEHRGRIAEPGSLAWNFKKVGTLEITGDQNPDRTPEDIEWAIIEAGAADLQTVEGGVWMVQTPFGEREAVRRRLEQAGTNIKEASHDYKPKNMITLDPQERDRIHRLCDTLSEHDDVQEVYTNLTN